MMAMVTNTTMKTAKIGMTITAMLMQIAPEHICPAPQQVAVSALQQ